MPIDGGSAREGRPLANVRPFVGRNRARGRPTQSLPASRRVARAHPGRVLRWHASSAQDAPDAAARGPAEPLVLSAERLSRCGAVRMRSTSTCPAAAAVLQGTDGLRAAQVVCRIVNVSNGGEPLYEVEVYAEGDVRDTSRPGTPRGQRPGALPRAGSEDAGLSARDGVEFACARRPATSRSCGARGFIRTAARGHRHAAAGPARSRRRDRSSRSRRPIFRRSSPSPRPQRRPASPRRGRMRPRPRVPTRPGPARARGARGPRSIPWSRRRR